MITHNDVTQSITVERAGRPMGNQLDTILRRTTHRTRDIQELNGRFHEDTGMYHNDIGFRNVLQDQDNHLYLIDFEYAHPENRDVDSDGILSST
jgi:thiamine kinase-like enzyme